VIGAVVAAWGLSGLRRSHSLAAVLRQLPLLLAAAWHAAFGRDAVLWSPLHARTAAFYSPAILSGSEAGSPDSESRQI
jgi:hypothetical protein